MSLDAFDGLQPLEPRTLLSGTGFVDLSTQVVGLTEGASLAQGDARTVWVVARNAGTRAAAGKAFVQTFLSADDQLGAGDRLLTSTKLKRPNIRAGGAKAIKVATRIPGNAATGTYHLLARVVQPRAGEAATLLGDNTAASPLFNVTKAVGLTQLLGQDQSGSWTYHVDDDNGWGSSTQTVNVTQLGGGRYRVTTDAGGGVKVNLSFTQSDAGTTLNAWVNKLGAFAVTLNMKPIQLGPRNLVLGRQYTDRKPASGTLRFNDGQTNVTASFKGNVTASCRLLRYEDVSTWVDSYANAAVVQYVIGFSGTVTARIQGRTIQAKLAGTQRQTAWCVDGIGMVKGQLVQTNKVTVPGEGTESDSESYTLTLTSHA